MRQGKVPGLEMCLALARGTKGRQPLNVRADYDNTTDQDVREETLVEVEETDNTQIDSQLDENTDQPVEKTTFVPPHNIKKRRVSKLAKLEQSIAKLQKIAENRPKSTASASKKQDEYDAFAQHMATQLRTLPLRSFIILQEQFQSLITKEKLKTMNPPPSPIMSTGSSYDDNDDSELQPYSQSIFQDRGTFYTELN
ncbi:hypothetical protein J6590_106332 [Homalodisca vitripennis]|nr:hypothetical protein J6590_106332 [Homalodisca vitripennis]